MSEPFYVDCYGEALVDLIVQPFTGDALNTSAQACLGGSVFNFCIAGQRQGLAMRYLNALSHDMFGQQFENLLKAQGVACAHGAVQPLPTSMAVVQLSAAGQASYAFHRQAVADTALLPEHIIQSFSASQQLLHTGCLMLVPEQWPRTQKIIQAAKSQGALISVDANMRLSVCPDISTYRPNVLAACAMADVVKVSDDDLLALGLLQAHEVADTAALLASAQYLLAPGTSTQLLALTLGSRGAYLLTRDILEFCAAPLDLKVQDTVGAGDSFFAALLAALAESKALSSASLAQLPPNVVRTSLVHAVAAASLCVERLGCDPASWQETRSYLQNRGI
jgi:fructokinase